MNNRIKQHIAPNPQQVPASDAPRTYHLNIQVPLSHPRIKEILFTAEYLLNLLLKK